MNSRPKKWWRTPFLFRSTQKMMNFAQPPKQMMNSSWWFFEIMLLPTISAKIWSEMILFDRIRVLRCRKAIFYYFIEEFPRKHTKSIKSKISQNCFFDELHKITTKSRIVHWAYFLSFGRSENPGCRIESGVCTVQSGVNMVYGEVGCVSCSVARFKNWNTYLDTGFGNHSAAHTATVYRRRVSLCIQYSQQLIWNNQTILINHDS